MFYIISRREREGGWDFLWEGLLIWISCIPTESESTLYIKHKYAIWDKNINYLRGKSIVVGETSENFWHVVDVITNWPTWGGRCVHRLRLKSKIIIILIFFINCKSKDNIDFSSIKNMILYELYTIKYYTNMYTNTKQVLYEQF